MTYLLRITLFILTFISSTALAQQMQWVKGGGTNETSAYLSTNPEGTYYMCTDPNGNVYALSIVGQNEIFADTFYRNGAYGVDINILLSSYNSAGQMRFAKLIASSAGDSLPFGIVADSSGHIYMAGLLPNGTLHIGYDTMITGLTQQSLGIIKFDTSGHFDWIRQVGNNTPSTYYATHSNAASISLDRDNNIHLIPYIGFGAQLLPSIISHTGSYDLKYNSTGILLSAKRLQLDSTIVVIGANIDKSSNILYSYGYRSPAYIDSSAYNFIAAFDTSGNRLWIDTLDDPLYIGAEGINGIVPDGYGHLYISGLGDGYVTYRGDTIGPPAGSTYSQYVSFIMKTDIDGNMKWVNTCNGNSLNAFSGITMMSENKIAAVGFFEVKFRSDIDSLSNNTPGSDPLIYIVDTAGHTIGLTQIHGNGYNDYGMAITSDKFGNLYIGGEVEDTIPTTTITPYHSVGGNTDFFILKYGMPVGCSGLPVAAFTSSGTNPEHFSYSGTTTGIDSVVWYFGDGASTTGLTPIHTYTASGTFTVCAYVYAYCGVDSACTNLSVSGVGINSVVPAAPKLAVYPNPAHDNIIVNVADIPTPATIFVIDIYGRIVLSKEGVIKQDSLDVSSFAPGAYIVKVQANGQVYREVVVIE